MSKRLWLWTLVLICSVITASGSFAKIYWLPEYLGSNMDKNRVSDSGLNENTTSKSCEEMNLVSSCPAHKKPTNAVSVGDKTCYVSCSCDLSYYQFSSSNCKAPKELEGDSCGALTNSDFSDSQGSIKGADLASFSTTAGTKAVAGTASTATSGTKTIGSIDSAGITDKANTIIAPGFTDTAVATKQGYFTACNCPSDYSHSSCPANSTCEKCDTKYKITGCSANYELVDGKCQATSCPSGYINPEDISERTALGQTCKSVTVSGLTCYLCECDKNKYCNATCPTGASGCSTCKITSTGTPSYKVNGCKTGYTNVTDSSGNIVSCKASPCPAGYTAGVTECSDDYSYLESGYSGEQKCGRCVCTPKTCSGYTLTSKPMNAVSESCVKGCGDNTTYYKIKSCYPNTTLVNDTCIYCPTGTTLVNGECVCPTGTTLVNGKCVYPSCQAFLAAKYPNAVYISDGSEMRDVIDDQNPIIILQTDEISKTVDLTYPVEIYTEDKFVEESNGVCKATGLNGVAWNYLFIDGDNAKITTNIETFKINQLIVGGSHSDDFLGARSVYINGVLNAHTNGKVVIPNEEVAFNGADINLAKNSNLVINNPTGTINTIETEEGSFLELGDHGFYGTLPLTNIAEMNIKGSVKLKHTASTMGGLENDDVLTIDSVNATISPKTGNTYTNNIISYGNFYIGDQYVSLDIQKNVNVLINSDFLISYCEEEGTCNEGMDDCDGQAYNYDFYEPVPYINGDITKFILNVSGSLQGIGLECNRASCYVLGNNNIAFNFPMNFEQGGYCNISSGTQFKLAPYEIFGLTLEDIGQKLDNN